MQNTKAIKQVLTATEVSERLRISLSTVHHLSRTGKIKGIKMGKQWRYVGEDVERCFVGDLTPPTPKRKVVSEKRKLPRINCFIKAQASRLLSPERSWAGDGCLLNLSVGGALFESQKGGDEDENLLQVNDPIILRLNLESHELKLNGRIVHLGPHQDKLRVGVKFRILNPEAEQTLQRYIG